MEFAVAFAEIRHLGAGAAIGKKPEKVMAQRRLRCYSRFEVVVQHTCQQVFEPGVVEVAVAPLSDIEFPRVGHDLGELAAERNGVTHPVHAPLLVPLLGEVPVSVLGFLYHPRRRHAQHLHVPAHLVLLVSPAEQRHPRVHLHQHAAEAPHVDGERVLDAEQHFRGTVEAALDVREALFVGKARAAEVDDFDLAAVFHQHQHVFGFEVAVDDVPVPQERQSLQDLLAELAHQIQRDAFVRGVDEQLVQVAVQQLEHYALVLLVLEVAFHAHDFGRVFPFHRVH
mmetsp:Transcript_4996/g.9211  ORF Transcript_4996/g.9211 Transcript_4996/m.9211 type:complete len:283 (-) Transcript_4996:219-1067(-)